MSTLSRQSAWKLELLDRAGILSIQLVMMQGCSLLNANVYSPQGMKGECPSGSAPCPQKAAWTTLLYRIRRAHFITSNQP